ncbi:MAG: UDP-N-acetyl-D-galactosamine dehydrogenase [Bacteroides sp. SM23_62_1]|nr:MAG: UDP-N-acetyl-D-galactosamine dehydrogenase [Bacteroides sp. SM23_62_1]
MYRDLVDKKTKMAVIGLGYVGLPIALEFARKISVIGFDLKDDRIKLMKKGIDPSKELSSDAFKGCDILFTSDLNDIREAKCYVVAVPTPIDEHKLPDLKPLLNATDIVGKVLKEGDFVVFESTVYPGCTEEDCVPILERNSGLTYIKQFKVGFSPERINPGDREHTLTRIIKVTSGCDEISAEEIAMIYELIIEAGVYRVSSIKVAEAAKVIENTQRDINIAFMNELSMIFHKMEINTYEVLEAAATKWNFLRFYPGLVGGHCIGVDPYYLSYKAKQYSHHAQIINSGRAINDGMGFYVADQVVKKLIAFNLDIRQCKVLVMGVTFKENVTDIRNSKAFDVINELRSFGFTVDIVDPRASFDEVKTEYGLELKSQPSPPYHAIIVTVCHKEYLDLDENYFKSQGHSNLLLVDLKGTYKTRINKLNYWSL